jgi:hypothetical protein
MGVWHKEIPREFLGFHSGLGEVSVRLMQLFNLRKVFQNH